LESLELPLLDLECLWVDFFCDDLLAINYQAMSFQTMSFVVTK
jgi:hypothetical protein